MEDGDLKALLKPLPADQMRIWPISPRVNGPINDDADIVVEIDHGKHENDRAFE
jgi:hypothetical protein